MKISVLFFLISVATFAQNTYKKKAALLGSPFEIIVVANDSVQGYAYCDMAIAEVKRVENLISDWIPTTQVSEINRNAGIKPVKVNAEVFGLIDRALKISHLTDGAFDISYASMDKIWKFDGSMKQMPSEEEIKASVSKVGYKNVVLNDQVSTVFLKNTGMKIGLGGIGQGYIADSIKELLQKKGCSSGLVNVSGDITTWGFQPDGSPWTVAIINPMNKEKVFASFPLIDSAVETSGSYEKFVTFNGKRYSHIIDPRTGYPATGIVSVTVFAKKTEIADALATSIFVMGKDVGISLIDQIPNIECIVVSDTGELFVSKNIDLKKYN
ncbi:MAG: FAD:protein FMN transferase [Flavobacterium haoranii]